MKRLFLVLSLIALPISLVSAKVTTEASVPSSPFITTAGVTVLNEGLIIEVQEFPHGLVAYKIKKIMPATKDAKRTSLEGPQEMMKANSGWFVYPESSTRIWAYEGNRYLVLHEIVKNPTGAGQGIKSTSSTDVPAVLKQAPKVVLDRFNAERAKSEPKPEPKKKETKAKAKS